MLKQIYPLQEDYRNAAEEILETSKLIKLEEAAQKSGLSASYLRATAQSGRLSAVKKEGVWYTTEMAVENYKNSRYQIVKPL